MTHWLDFHRGQSLGGALVDDENPDFSGGVSILLYDRPDWVRLPPELGGEPRRLLSVETTDCPCGAEHDHKVRVFNLEDEYGILVFECPDHGFLWCQKRSTE